MSRSRLIIVCIFLIFLFPGCKSAVNPINSTISVIHIELSTNLQEYSPSLYDCAAKQNSGLVIHTNTNDQYLYSFDLVFSLGEVKNPAGLVFIVGKESFLPVVNATNPINQLSLSQLNSLFSSTNQTWGDIVDFKTSSNDPEQNWENFKTNKVQPYIFFPGNPVSSLINDTFLSERLKNPLSRITMDIGTMKTGLEMDAAGIGFLPSNLSSHSLKFIKIEGVGEITPSLPILAYSLLEPQGIVRTFLKCSESVFPEE